MGRYRGLDLTLVKPLTYMNDSGLAVRKVLAREHAPLVDLLVVADDFALPFGKLRFREGGGHGGHNGLRSIIDELGTEKFSRLRVGIGEPGARLRRPRPVDVRARRAAAPRRAARRGGRRGRGVGARRARTRRPTGSTRSSSGRPTRTGSPPPGEVDGPPGPDGIRRTRTGWRRVRPPGPDGDERPLRARPDRVASGASPSASPTSSRSVSAASDRDDASTSTSREVDAEVEARPTREAAGAPARPRPRPTPAPAAACPDLAALPPLLAATGSFGSLRERSVAADARRAPGRHAGLAAVPHGAKTYLAAALALGGAASGSCWIARDAEIGDRVAEELGAWLGDPAAVAVLEPRTALAYERSELVADETAARVAALAAWRSGRARILVASVQALLQHTIAPDDLPDRAARARGRRAAPPGRAPARAARARLRRPVLEVAGRGEFARRGGIVDVFPPSAPLPVRIEFFGDEIDSLRAFDPTDQRTVGTVERVVLLPASRVPAAARGGRGSASASGDGGRSCPSGSPRTSPGSRARTIARARPPRPAGGATRALAVGDAAEVWAPLLAPATGLDHVDPGTLLVLDEPGDLAEAAEFLWRQADERRAELIEAGELPEGLAVDLPRSARLEGPAGRGRGPSS